MVCYLRAVTSLPKVRMRNRGGNTALSFRLLHQAFLQDDAGETNNPERHGVGGKITVKPYQHWQLRGVFASGGISKS